MYTDDLVYNSLSLPQNTVSDFFNYVKTINYDINFINYVENI